jgi:hypothetical protein
MVIYDDEVDYSLDPSELLVWEQPVVSSPSFFLLDSCLSEVDQSRVSPQVSHPPHVSEVVVDGSVFGSVLEPLPSRDFSLGFVHSQLSVLSSLLHSGFIGACSSRGVFPLSYS